MNFSKTIFFAAVIVLTVLLNSIDYSFYIPEFSAGILSELNLNIDLSALNNDENNPLALLDSFKTDTLIFVGDVMLARNVEYLMDKNGSNYPFSGVNLNTLAVNPIVVGNFEASIPETHIPTPAYKMRFSVNHNFLPVLKESGFDYLSLANNHSFDYGSDGYEQSKQMIKQSEMIPFGHPSDHSTTSVVYTEVSNSQVALIGLHTLTNPITHDELEQIFTEANKKSDFQIIYIHWGEEYKNKNNLAQKKLATELIELGADLIVGHHPHVVQNIDLINDVPVFYSLGNYVFDQYFSTETQIGLLLKTDFSSNLVEMLPISSLGKLSQPHLMSEKDSQDFLEDLAKISHPDLKGQILDGYITLNSRVASSSKIAMMD